MKDRLQKILIAPSLVILGTFFVVPLFWVLILSFVTSDDTGRIVFQLTFENYSRFLGDRYYLQDLLLRTIWLSGIATAFSVVIGYIGATLIVRAKPEVQSWLILLVMCPLWVNLVVRTLSLLVILGRKGIVNDAILGLGLSDGPIRLLYNDTAVVIGMVQVAVPFVVMAIYGVLRSIPRQLEHAAMTVGATPLSAFRRVTLPLSVPGILAGTVLAFGINIESFVVPLMLGGGRVRFMSVAAYEMATVSNNMPFAATIGVILLIVTIFILGIYQWAIRTASSSAPMAAS